MHRALFAAFAAILFTVGAAGTVVAADPAAIKESCVKNTNWSEKACQCLADKASSLSPAQQDYLVAMLTEDTAGETKAEAELSVTQFAKVSMFIVNSAEECQGD